MATVSVRYIVDDVDAAIRFYCGYLGFRETMHPAPTFAMLSRGDLRLVLPNASFLLLLNGAPQLDIRIILLHGHCCDPKALLRNTHHPTESFPETTD